MFAPNLPARLHPPPGLSGALPSETPGGAQGARHVQEMERQCGGDMAKLYAYAAQQPPARQAAFIDHSEGLRDFLGIGDPDRARQGPAARLAAAEAPAALAMAATCSAKEVHVQRALARLEAALAVPPAQPRARQAHQQCLEQALDRLLQHVHQLPTDAARQQAARIAQRLLPQLQADGQARIRACAYRALAQRGIGSELKECLQELLPAARPDSRGRAGFEAALRRLVPASVADRSVVSRGVDALFEPVACSNYGPFNKVQVDSTRFARQAAELLIDDSGKLTGARMASILEQLHGDDSMLAEHKSHVIRTLAALEHNGTLAATIDSICAGKPPTGGAADVVRATLNLPPDQALTEGDARKAVVMSLLGYLRQGNVGSCYATAPAICLLDSAPHVVAHDMKELLENNKMTFSKDNVLLDVPLNRHIQQLHAQTKVWVKPDGTTMTPELVKGADGTSQLKWKEEARLQDVAGMRAALTALGIPEPAWQAALTGALQLMMRNGVDPTKNGVNFQQIIQFIARGDVAAKIESAQLACIGQHNMVAVSKDGRSADGGQLHELPGVQAALAALGIPAGRQQACLADQLKGEFTGEFRQLDVVTLMAGVARAVSNEQRERLGMLDRDGMDAVVKTMPNGVGIDGVKLQDIPVISEALTALGIPERLRPGAIGDALRRAFRSGIDPTKEGIRCGQVIEHLAQANPATMEKLAVTALKAKHHAVKVNQEGMLEDGTRLQDLPGIQAALRTLGIAEALWPAVVRDTLQRMVEKSVKLDKEIMLTQFVGYLAADPQQVAEVKKRQDGALRAFNGVQDVALLRTWEYTLAGASQLGATDSLNLKQWNLAQVSTAIFHGEMGEHAQNLELRAPGLYSLHEQMQMLVDDLESEFEFEDIDFADIAESLFSAIDTIMKSRFVYEMDMNVVEGAATDGVSTHGGFVLCEKVPADDPSQWKRIDNADAFMTAIAGVAKDAIDGRRADMAADSNVGDEEMEALQKFADFITGSLGEPAGREGFLKHAILLMNLEETADTFSMEKIDQYSRTPWKKTGGSNTSGIVAQYGGKYVAGPAVAPGPDGVMSFVESLCAGLARMAPQLQDKAAQGPDGFKTPIVLPGHGFTLMPMEMKEVWSGDPATRMTAQDWAAAHARQPAMAWRDASRTEPPLSALLASAGAALGASGEQVQALLRAMGGDSEPSGPDAAAGPPYTLKALHDKLGEYCRTQENGDALLAKATQVLTNALPIPAKVIADTNWISSQGRPVYIGILYNPFTDKMDAQSMHQDGSGRAAVRADWTDPKTFGEGYPFLYTPVSASREGEAPAAGGHKRKFDER